MEQFVRPNRYRKTINKDGFVASIGLFPPPSKRGVTIIDPPYEIKDDYDRVVSYVKNSHKRFASGVILVWYPVVDRYRIDKMESALVASGVKNIQLYELNVDADTEQKGMTGSGMIVINPPWTLAATMQEALPFLVKQLSPENGWSRQLQLVEE